MRHAGRVTAVQVLYGLDACATFMGVDQALEGYFDCFGAEVQPDERAFAEALCRGVAEHLVELDRTLEQASANWRVSRMSRVDRNVLRLAVYELTCRPETPAAVVVDEAVELAKQLGSTESGKFINGVLGQVIARLEAGDAGRGR